MNNTNKLSNFNQSNFREVNVGANKVAWTFCNANIEEEYGQIWSREYPSTFFIRTQSDAIYKVFRPNRQELLQITKGDMKKTEHFMNNCPTEWCLFDPQTQTVVAVENPHIKHGESFAFAPKCTTDIVKEIVGVSSSQLGVGQSQTLPSTSFTSNILEEFTRRTK